jgi:hypothetical protein
VWDFGDAAAPADPITVEMSLIHATVIKYQMVRSCCVEFVKETGNLQRSSMYH